MATAALDNLTSTLLYGVHADAIKVLELCHSPSVAVSRILATELEIGGRLRRAALAGERDPVVLLQLAMRDL